ncbi:MAG: metallophosphoesterase family protein [Pseudomonadota bacterium]
MRRVIEKLRAKRAAALQAAPAKVPPGLRIYAIGDIHGRDDLLARLLAMIAADAAGWRGALAHVFIGDYVDRGGQSAAVLDRLIALSKAPSWQPCFLMGNHEQAMLDFLADAPEAMAWLDYGGRETLASYGVEMPEGWGLAALRQALRAALPPAHLRFLKNLVYSHQAGDYFFCHAGVRPGIALAAQDLDDLLWIREPFLSSGADHGKVVVHGHTIADQPVVRANRIGIDTGAYMSGRLTAVVLEGTRQRFLST